MTAGRRKAADGCPESGRRPVGPGPGGAARPPRRTVGVPPAGTINNATPRATEATGSGSRGGAAGMPDRN